MPADRVGPLVDAEAFEQAEGPTVVHALQDAEEPAEVHQRRVDDRDAGTQPEIGVGVALVVLGAGKHPRQRLVGQGYPLRRPGRPARQHLDRNARPRVIGSRPGIADDVDDTERVADEPACFGSERDEVFVFTGEGSGAERLEIGAHPFRPTLGVRGDDARAGAKETEQQADMGRAVAQQHGDAFAGRDMRLDGIRRRAEVAPWVPAALELERGHRRVEREHLGDALAQVGQLLIHQRNLGSGRSGPFAATSAAPIGLPSRV